MDDQLKIIINTGLNTKNTSQIEADLKTIEKALQDKQIKVSASFDTSKIKQHAENASKQIDNSIKTKIPNVSVGFEVNQKKLDQAKSVLLKQMQILQAQANKASIDLNVNGNQTKFNDLVSTNNMENMKDAGYNLKMMRLEYQKLNAETVKDLPNTALEGVNKKLVNMPFAITKVETSFAKLKTPTQEVTTQVVNLNNLLNNANNATTNDEKIQSFNQLKNAVLLAKNEIASLQAVENKDILSEKLTQGIAIGSNRLSIFSQQLKATARKEYADKMDDISNSFKNVKNQADLTKANTSLREFETNMKAMGNVGDTVFTKLGKNIRSFIGFLGSATIVMSGINAVKSMITSVVELDTQMVELRKVTDETEETYKSFYNQANITAKNLGVQTSAVISATASWAQMGYSIQDATELAKSSEILSNISENMDVSQATSTLVSGIKAFGLDVNNVLDGVVSKINEVGNQFAVTNTDIADILQRSSSAMADANNTMEQTIALGTAATEITRDAESAGKMYARVA